MTKCTFSMQVIWVNYRRVCMLNQDLRSDLSPVIYRSAVVGNLVSPLWVYSYNTLNCSHYGSRTCWTMNHIFHGEDPSAVLTTGIVDEVHQVSSSTILIGRVLIFNGAGDNHHRDVCRVLTGFSVFSFIMCTSKSDLSWGTKLGRVHIYVT